MELSTETSAPKVLEYQSDLDYVAISHVWSDGLGNENDNSLPECQLQAIREAAVQIKHPQIPESYVIRIWIDTLCIPCRPEDRRFRKLAISRLKTTFENARAVVVLDNELRQTALRSQTEGLFRLECSSWMRRLWTLEEGILGEPRLFVPFKNRILDVDSAREEIWATEEAEGAFCHSVHYLATISSVRSIVLAKGCRRISWLWSELRWRTASHRGDQEIVLAGLLGFDPASVIDIPLHDRLQKIYSMLSEFPQNVLFNRGPRFQRPGYRWALSVLPDYNTENLSGKPAKRLGDSGLLVEFPGLIFQGTLPALPFFVKECNEIYCVYPRKGEEEASKTVFGQGAAHRYAIIFDEKLFGYVHNKDLGNLWFGGACVKIKEEIEKTVFCTLEGVVKVSLVSQAEISITPRLGEGMTKTAARHHAAGAKRLYA